MPSAFYWPLLVPCAPAGLRRQLTSSLGSHMRRALHSAPARVDCSSNQTHRHISWEGHASKHQIVLTDQALTAAMCFQVIRHSGPHLTGYPSLLGAKTVTCDVYILVRPSFPKLSGSQMSSFRKALESWFDAQGMGFLTGFNAHQISSTGRMGSYSGRSGWLSVLRQPAHHRAASKCHTPSALRAACPAAVSATSGGAKVPFAIGLLLKKARWSSPKSVRLANSLETSKGAPVQHHFSSNHGQFAVCSTPSTPRQSLS